MPFVHADAAIICSEPKIDSFFSCDFLAGEILKEIEKAKTFAILLKKYLVFNRPH